MYAVHSDKSARPGDGEIESALGELLAVRADMVAEVARSRARLATVHPNYQESARNLLHYLALRRRDLVYRPRHRPAS